MTKRERFLAFANFEPVDRIPRYASYVDDLYTRMKELLREEPSAYFNDDVGYGAGLTPPAGYRFPDYTVYHPEYKNGEDGFSIDGNGCGHLNHGFYHFTEYISPLRNATSIAEHRALPGGEQCRMGRYGAAQRRGRRPCRRKLCPASGWGICMKTPGKSAAMNPF